MRLAICGATGAVGREAAHVLETSSLKTSDVRFFASARSASHGITIPYKGTAVRVEDLACADFREFDVAIFSIGSKASRDYVSRVRQTHCVMVDNSSAFRMNEHVPLVVPEINADAISGHRGVIANPNCTTAIAMMAVAPLHNAFGIVRMSATSYQSASGAGAAGLQELNTQINARVGDLQSAGGVWEQKMFSNVFPAPIAMNVIPQIGSFGDNGFTDEEMKMLNEGRKILSHPTLLASTTCVRVPVERVHCIDVLAQFKRPISLDRAYAALRAMPGLDVFPDVQYPTPLMYAGKHNCAVGRLRLDTAFDNALRFFVAGDQLLKGAALNAVQIAEKLAA